MQSRHFNKVISALLAWCMVCALLLSQTLGFVHGITHAGSYKPSHTATAKPAGQSKHSVVNALFSSHNGEADCRLFDQASHGSAVTSPVVVMLPVVLPSLAVAIFQGEALARWAALFDARGPPLTF